MGTEKGLLSLPNEIILLIITHSASESAISSLSRTCKLLHKQITDLLYQYNDKKCQELVEEFIASCPLTKKGKRNGQERRYPVDDSGHTRLPEHIHRQRHAAFWAVKNNVPNTLYRVRNAGIDLCNWDLVSYAAQQGFPEVLDVLLDSPEAKAEFLNADDGMHLIECACDFAAINNVEKLLELGVDISGDANTALHLAAATRSEALVRLLLEAGIEPHESAPGTYGMSAIKVAASNRQIAMMEMLLDHGADINDPNARGGPIVATAVSQSEKTGETSILALALSRGAKLDNMHIHGQPPLSYAARNCPVDTVRLLLEYGADVAEKQHNRRLAVDEAIDRSEVDLILLLLTQHMKSGASITSAQQPLLDTAARRNWPEVVELLLQLGVDVDKVTRCGCTPLSHACEDGHLEIAKMLIDKGGANLLWIKEKTDETYLHKLVDYDNPAVSDYILDVYEKAGFPIEINKKNEDGRTALQQAFYYQDWYLAETFIKRLPGVNIEYTNTTGRDLSFAVARAGQTTLLQALRDAGSKLDVVDHYGANLLTVAVRNGQQTTAEWLLQVMPTLVNAVDVFDMRVIDWAIRTGDGPLVELINKHLGSNELASTDIEEQGKDDICFCDVCLRVIPLGTAMWKCARYSECGSMACSWCGEHVPETGLSLCAVHPECDSFGEWSGHNFGCACLS